MHKYSSNEKKNNTKLGLEIENIFHFAKTFIIYINEGIQAQRKVLPPNQRTNYNRRHSQQSRSANKRFSLLAANKNADRKKCP